MQLCQISTICTHLLSLLLKTFNVVFSPVCPITANIFNWRCTPKVAEQIQFGICQILKNIISAGNNEQIQFAKRSGEISKYATQAEQLGGRSKAEAAMRNFGSLDCGPRLINYLEGDSPRSDYSPVLDIFPSLGIFDESDLSD